MLPGLVLQSADIERRAADLAEKHVAVGNHQVPLGQAHRRRAVAAAARLVEDHRPVVGTDFLDQFQRALCRLDLVQHHNTPSCREQADPGGVKPSGSGRGSEEAELLRAVADQQVLGLLVVMQHHQVVFAADAGLLVAAKRRVCRVGVVAVGPDPAGLDRPAEPVAGVGVAAPDAGAKAVERVIGDLQRFRVGLEGADGDDRSEDLFLEDPHLVVALEYGRLDVIAAFGGAAGRHCPAADQHFGTLLAADIHVGQDFLELLARGLRTDHCVELERIALDDGRDALERAGHEFLVDVLVDQGAARAGADLALVEGEQHEAFDRLVEEVIIVIGDILEEDVGRLAPELERAGNDVLAGILHDQPAGGGFAGERDLGDARRRRQRLACFQAEAVDHVDHARRQDVGDQLHQHHDRGRGLFGRLEHHAIAGRQRRRQFPDRHQQREVPGNDLADHAERFMEMIGDGVGIEFAERAFLGPDDACEIAEMVDAERHVGGCRLADRLAVVPGLGLGQYGEVVIHRLGDPVEQNAALGHAGRPPGVLCGMRGIQRQFDVLGVRACHLAQDRSIDRRDVVEILAVNRFDKLAADEVSVFRLECESHAVVLPSDCTVQWKDVASAGAKRHRGPARSSRASVAELRQIRRAKHEICVQRFRSCCLILR